MATDLTGTNYDLADLMECTLASYIVTTQGQLHAHAESWVRLSDGTEMRWGEWRALVRNELIERRALTRQR